jgi:lipopolysaccharide/colanic/teichoic acid biosynthesis glycosyltransferase
LSTVHAFDGGTDRLNVTPRERLAKRTFDLVAGIPLCLLVLPVVTVLAVVLAVRHRTWPFFMHERVGRGGRTIPFPKLRTLSPEIHPYADKTLSVLTPPSRFAAFLRASHLDELPQIFLVPLGYLSLVGPRPRMLPEAVAHGDDRYEALRTSVQQGCTGLWQISGYQGRVSDRPEYDEFYVAHRNVRLDLWILWRTVRQLVAPSVVELDDVPAWTLRRRPTVLADAA